MKNLSDIVAEELEKALNSPKMREILDLMDNINPSGLCVLCGVPVGKAHLLCPTCYGAEKLKE